MASQPPSEIPDILSCNVCAELYDTRTHKPKILPCQHTFCQRCLNRLPSTSTTIKCPICRSSHAIPFGGFTTNGFVIELLDNVGLNIATTTAGLKCTVHEDMACALVCVDCAECLCTKCGLTDLRTLRKNPHRTHHLVEPVEAKTLLGEQLKRIAKTKQAALDKKLARIENDPQVEKLIKAEEDVMKLKNQIITMTENWAVQQLRTIRNIEKEAAVVKRRLNIERKNLQPLLFNQNMDIKNLIAQLKNFKILEMEQQGDETSERQGEPREIARLRQERQRTRQKRSYERAKYNTRRVRTERKSMENQQYNFREKCQELTKDLHSVLNRYKPVKTIITPRKTQWKFVQKRTQRSEISNQEVHINKYVHDTEHGADVLVFRIRDVIVVFDRTRRNVHCFGDQPDDSKLAIEILQYGPNATANGRFSHDIREALGRIKPLFG